MPATSFGENSDLKKGITRVLVFVLYKKEAKEVAKVTGSKRKRIDTEEDTWVACDKCNKWRMLPADAPPVGDGKWYCAMNPDDRYNACGAPEQTADES